MFQDISVNSAERSFLEHTPTMKIEVVEEDVPCSTECLRQSGFSEVLSDDSFREQLEIIDSIISLIRDNVQSLRDKVSDNFKEDGVNRDNLAYAIYRLVEEGGDVVFGSNYLKYNERVIFEGDFNLMNSVYKRISTMREDVDVRAICDQIRNLSEATWRHVNKNLKKMFTSGSNES